LILLSLGIHAGIPPAFGGHATTFITAEIDWEAGGIVYQPDSMFPTGIDIHIEGEYWKDNPGPPPNPCDECASPVKVRVVLIDCNGDEMDQQEKEYPVLNCEPIHYEHKFSFSWECPPPTYPDRYRIDLWHGAGNENCNGEQITWDIGNETQLDPIESAHCPATVEQMKCRHSYPGEHRSLGYESIVLHKRTRALFSLPADDSSGATYGEIVNGTFTAPHDGMLIVTFEVTDRDGRDITDVVDLYGSSSQDAPGWHRLYVPEPLRKGVKINSEHCVDLLEGGEFRFSIGARKTSLKLKATVSFTLYAPSNSNCAFPRSEGKLELPVMPLPCILPGGDPVTPVRWLHNIGEGEEAFVDVEVQKPCCGDSAGADLTLSFILWPTIAGTDISEGHMIGWQSPANHLVSPGPGRTTYSYNK